MRQQATPANTNDSAAPRPTSAATPGPENDMASAGDIAPTDSPIASHTCRSRLSPCPLAVPGGAVELSGAGPLPAWSRVSLIGPPLHGSAAAAAEGQSTLLPGA